MTIAHVQTAQPDSGAPEGHDARARIIAFYLPQFHPIPENDEWWGQGFTEWTNVARARPLFPGHMQPRLPSELGYYDLRVPEVRACQSELARAFGIEGFCYWHYWFEGRRLLERPFSEVVAYGQPDFPFCLAWANQSWTGVWHGAPDRVLIQQTYGGDVDARRHFEAILPALLDRRYLRVDGYPIFVINEPHQLPKPRRFTALWNELARAEGLPGIFFLGTQDVGWSAQQFGFDGTVLSNPWRVLHYRVPSRIDRLLASTLGGRDSSRLQYRLFGWPTRVTYADVLRHAAPAQIPESVYPTVLPNWDNTPRSGRRGIVITGSSPERFRVHLDRAIASVESRPFDHRLVFLKSWNEWAEGNFIEPDAAFGREYLAAVRETNAIRNRRG